jgi:hypothetical protein
MIQAKDYVNLKGEAISIADLTDAERKLVAKLTRQAKEVGDWNEFENYWTRAVTDFYAGSGLSRKQARATGVYRIAQDLGSRLAVQAGIARAPDYRDELSDLIQTRFQTRRAFCQATGLTEDMLSHVLAGRKHLAIETLADALSRIGFSLRIVPAKETVVEPKSAT